MIPLNIIPSYSQGMVENYKRYSLSIQALYREAVMLGTLYERADRILKDIQGMAVDHMDEVEDRFEQLAVEMVRYASNDVLDNFGQIYAERMEGDNRPLEEYIEQLKDNALQAYSAQISRDIKQIRQLIMQYRVRVQMLMDQRDEGLEAAKRSAFFEFMEPEFVYRDQNNRKFKGEDFLYATINPYLVYVYNRTFLYLLARMGENTFTVRHPEGKYQNNVYTILDFDGNTMETYDEIEPKIFHPRTNSLVDYHDEAA